MVVEGVIDAPPLPRVPKGASHNPKTEIISDSRKPDETDKTVKTDKSSLGV